MSSRSTIDWDEEGEGRWHVYSEGFEDFPDNIHLEMHGQTWDGEATSTNVRLPAGCLKKLAEYIIRQEAWQKENGTPEALLRRLEDARRLRDNSTKPVDKYRGAIWVTETEKALRAIGEEVPQ